MRPCHVTPALPLQLVLAICGLQAAHAQETQEQTLEQVRITAQKRSEALQGVPISVTALEQRDLERMGIERLSDLARETPGLAVVSSGPGQNILIIRGISSVAGTAGTVGYYLDDTPVSASSNASLLSLRGLIDPSVFDIARVEVLRGPQGTLYGSSSMGGTIKYISTLPDLRQFSGRAAATLSHTAGGGWNADGNAALNIPLGDGGNAGLRLGVYLRHADGYIDRYPIPPNDILGIGPGGRQGKNANTEQTKGARAALRVNLGDGLVLNGSVYYQQMRLGAPFQVDVPPGSFGNLIQTRLAPEPGVQNTSLSNLTVHKGFSGFELVSSTSYYDRHVAVNEDASKVLYYFLSPKPQTSVYPVRMHGEYINREFTQEVRALSDFKGSLQLIAGLFYHHVKAPLASEIPVTEGYNSRFGTDFSSFFIGARQATVRETALFSEAAYQLLPKWTARLGMRAFRVKQGFAQQGDGLFNGGPSAVISDSSDHGYTPRLNLSWQGTPDLLLFATASKGYRAGGPNNPAPAALCAQEVAGLGLSDSALRQFSADTLWSYEAGAKSQWLARRLTLNASLYSIDWSKVQQQIVLQCGFNITANFGSARSKGAELEASYQPSPQLTLRFNAGYNSATLNNDVPGTGAMKGDNLLDVPRWSGGAAAEYNWSWNAGHSAFARLSITYTGSANSLYDRTSPFYRHSGFAEVNLQAGWHPAGRKPQWRASLLADNLLDKTGQTGLPVAISADLPTTRRVAINRPRTVGIKVELSF